MANRRLNLNLSSVAASDFAGTDCADFHTVALGIREFSAIALGAGNRPKPIMHYLLYIKQLFLKHLLTNRSPQTIVRV